MSESESKINDGGAAFPFIAWQAPGGMVGTAREPGMSLRDWLAGQALAGICARQIPNHDEVDVVAMMAYSLADALIKRRTDERDRDLSSELL